jgi:hypothetical protein
MKKMLKPFILVVCIVGMSAIGVLRFRDMSMKFGFPVALSAGLIVLGGAVIFLAFVVKQALEVSKRRDPSN